MLGSPESTVMSDSTSDLLLDSADLMSDSADLLSESDGEML